MTRPRLTPRLAGAAFVLLSSLVAAGLAWVTSAALAAEEAQRQTARREERWGRERLALWRLDGQLVPVLALENSRPPAHYAASPGSPLRGTDLPPWIRLHFELDPAAGWRSPQAAEQGGALEQLHARFPAADAARLFAARGVAPPAPALRLASAPARDQDAAKAQEAERTDRVARKRPDGRPGRLDQDSRQQLAERNLSYGVALENPNRHAVPAPAAFAADADPPRFGPLTPCRLRDSAGAELLLVRAVAAGAGTVYQGFWIDSPRLAADLAASVRDLLPAAELRPLADGEAPPPESLSALPLRLDAGPPEPLPPAPWTTLRLGLALTWGAVVIALAAVGLGVGAVLRLAERRARFVSAVTHELRTPLTSLRLYLDLLTGGLVTDEATRQEYLATLSAESERLNALIGNVLDFARLENRPAALQFRPVKLTALLEELEATWRARCRAGGKELLIVNTMPEGQKLLTDARMVGQVVGNLIENACKYARDAADPRVWLWAKPGERGGCVLEVEDRGPGVSAGERRGIFAAFRRGSEQEPIGGVGLGLALAREWSRALGGRLVYRPAEGGVGACFRLELPRTTVVSMRLSEPEA